MMINIDPTGYQKWKLQDEIDRLNQKLQEVKVCLEFIGGRTDHGVQTGEPCPICEAVNTGLAIIIR